MQAYAGKIGIDILKTFLRYVPVIPLPPGFYGFALFTIGLVIAFLLLPSVALEPSSSQFMFTIGLIAMWRYTWGGINFFRSIIYRDLVFPKWRRKVSAYEDSLMPSQIYMLITSFRIDSDTTQKVIHSAIQEAIHCGVEATIVASVVELADENFYKEIFYSYNPPERVRLIFVRIPGTGKRDALAQGFRAISRDIPAGDAIVALIDGDTVLSEGCLRQCTPFFKLRPNLGALTTDEEGIVDGDPLVKSWYNLRFAQRHILMSSLSLSRRVMTLTGRMSMYRADVITHPSFIDNIVNDHLNHWRLGRFRFLTGDDKSNLYWVLKEDYEQIYVPDVKVYSYEDPPSSNFFLGSTRLMFRWFGNMLRTNSRVLALGPVRVPIFIWWSFFDQRLSMWTSLSGPLFTIMLTIAYSPVFIAYYMIWVAFTRWFMAVGLLSARKELNWMYPMLLYYNQVYGSLIKTYAFFNMDQQSWTRQKTKLERKLTTFDQKWNHYTSLVMQVTVISTFVASVGLLSGVLIYPQATVNMVTGVFG